MLNKYVRELAIALTEGDLKNASTLPDGLHILFFISHMASNVANAKMMLQYDSLLVPIQVKITSKLE